MAPGVRAHSVGVVRIGATTRGMGHCGRRPEAVLRGTHRACSRAGTRLRQCGPHAMHAAQPESPAIRQARHRSPSPALKTDMHTRSRMRRLCHSCAGAAQHGAEQDFTLLHTLKSASRLFLSATALTDSRRVGISADVAHVAASTERVVRDDQLVVRVVVRAVPPQHTCAECGPPSVKLWPPLRSTADKRTNPL